VWLHTSVVMPAACARRRTIFQALIRSSGSPLSSAWTRPYGLYLMAWKRGARPASARRPHSTYSLR